MEYRPFVVAQVDYKARDIGYGVEEGSFEGYWNGEIDTWGKLTFVEISGRIGPGPGPFYLFPDELREVEYLDGQEAIVR
jgi:hypothetical protein